MPYSTTADMSLRFGAPNVTKWADLEGDGSQVTARVAAAIEYADSEIDMALRGGGYAVPIVSNIPNDPIWPMVKNWSCVIAGVWLYTARGLLDENQEGKLKGLEENVRNQLDRVRSGELRLTVRKWAPNPTAPACI